MVSYLWQGALLTLLGVITGFIGNWALNWLKRRQKIKAVKQGIHDELKELKQIYGERMGGPWKRYEENVDEVFEFQLSFSQDYFTMYHSNANLIGQIPNSNLRREIVKVYTLLKVITDFYIIYGSFLDKRGKARDEGKEDAAEKIHGQLRNATPRMKKNHDRLVLSIENLLKMLNKELSPKPSPVLYGFTNNSK